jgi:tyrosyl-tRNA synthetase
VDLERRIELVGRSPTEEVVTLEDLRHLFEVEQRPKHYIGLEISGPLHIGSLVVTGFKLRDFVAAGVRTTIFLADWHSYINDKLGGDWERIKRAAHYYEEAFKLYVPGAEVVLGSDLYQGNDEYWVNLIRFTKRITLQRVVRCLTIMGRSEREKLDFAQYLYPPLQAVDIRALGVQIAHAGMDQRKVHMLVREVYPKLGWEKPVAVHHHILAGLSGQDKMSKSKPETCIFIHDSFEAIRAKLKQAWCPAKQIDPNPVLELVRYVVFHEHSTLEVDRPAKYGGPVTYHSFGELAEDYGKGQLHPADLKEAVAVALDKIIDPVRRYFEGRMEVTELFAHD